MATTTNFKFESLREVISRGVDDIDLNGDTEDAKLDQVFSYVNKTEEIGDYLHYQVKAEIANTDVITSFFATYAPNALKGDYVDGSLYDVFLIRDLDLREVSAVALAFHTLTLSHIDLFVDNVDNYDLDFEDEAVAFGDYLSTLIEFLWYSISHALVTHRPEDRATITIALRDPEIFQCLANNSELVVPEKFGDVNVIMCCEPEKDVKIPTS